MQKSDSITKLAAALVAFHGEVGKVGKDSTNPHFRNKYASLSNILEVVTPVLTACKLSIIQIPTGTNTLETILLHESGEWIGEAFTMPPVKNDPQGVGSAITYARRYALGAVLSLNIDADDDGNAASKTPAQQPATKQPVRQPREGERIYDEAISRVERATGLEDLANIFNQYPTLKNDTDFLNACGLRKKQIATPAKPTTK